MFVEDRRVSASLRSKVGRWFINAVAVGALPTIVFLWQDRDEKARRLTNVEFIVSTGLQMANFRIDNLERKVTDGQGDIKDDIKALRQDVKEMYQATKRKN